MDIVIWLSVQNMAMVGSASSSSCPEGFFTLKAIVAGMVGLSNSQKTPPLNSHPAGMRRLNASLFVPLASIQEYFLSFNVFSLDRATADVLETIVRMRFVIFPESDFWQAAIKRTLKRKRSTTTMEQL
jgi:hypothetical protein